LHELRRAVGAGRALLPDLRRHRRLRSDAPRFRRDACQFSREDAPRPAHSAAAARRPRARPHEPSAPAPRAQSGRDDEAERVVFVVRPTLLFIKIGYLLAALGGILLVALFAYFAPDPRLTYVSFALALALLLIPAYHHVRRQMVRYTLTDSKIEIDEGFISQTTRNLPLRNIQDVTVKTTVFQRLCGFGDLVIDNANETGGPTVLDNIPEPRRHMDMLLRELRRWR